MRPASAVAVVVEPEVASFVPPECVNGYGSIRLKLVRDYVRRHGGIDANLELVRKIYLCWAKFPEYIKLKPFLFLPQYPGQSSAEALAKLPVELIHECPRIYALAPKKGNALYVKRVSSRVASIVRKAKVANLFKFSSERRVSNGLFLSLTTVSGKGGKPIEEAWRALPAKWEAFLKSIRQHFKCKKSQLHVFKVVEATEAGFPHIHCVVIVENESFPYFVHVGKREKVTLRLDTKRVGGLKHLKFIKQSWFRLSRSFSDVQVLGVGSIGKPKASASKDFYHCVKYLRKDVTVLPEQTGSSTYNKLLNTLAFQWFFQLNAFNASKGIKPDKSKGQWLSEYVGAEFIASLHIPLVALWGDLLRVAFIYEGTTNLLPVGAVVFV